MEYLWPPAWLVAVGAPTTRLPASGNQEERQMLMQKNSQKRGIALGSVLALLASLFAGVMPAQAADAVNGDKIALTPLEGPVSNFNGSILEDFPVMAYLLPGVSTSSSQASYRF